MKIYQAVDHLDDNQIDKISVIIENPQKKEEVQKEEAKIELQPPAEMNEEEMLAMI